MSRDEDLLPLARASLIFALSWEWRHAESRLKPVSFSTSSQQAGLFA